MKIDSLKVAQTLVNDRQIHFSKIETEAQWRQLGDFRRESYCLSKPYMMLEIGEDGLDVIDEYGSVYAAWQDNQVIGTIRLCPCPFESTRYIDALKLQDFLGGNYEAEYLEWSRLLISPSAKISGLLPAMIVYAGLETLLHTPYKKYFGYSTLLIRRLFARFLLAREFMEFQIPHRGDHRYTLLKGDFSQDLYKLMQCQQFKVES